MIDRDRFVGDRHKRWNRLDELVSGSSQPNPASWSELATLYRSVCADLSTARGADLPEDIEQYLDELAARAHNRLYSVRRRDGRPLWRTLLSDFPRELRNNGAFFLTALVLFYGPFFVGIIGPLVDPTFASSVLSEQQLETMENMYSTAPDRGSLSADSMMAGFYVYNNVGIAFRCFASGALAGLGTLYTLVYNGLVLGTIEGHLLSVGLGWSLLEFTAGHSAWELTGIVVAGTAGLRLGWAMVVPGEQTRAHSLRSIAPTLYRLVMGAAGMLLVAATIEGFWSGSPLDANLKFAFGGLQAVLVIVWLSLGGRR